MTAQLHRCYCAVASLHGFLLTVLWSSNELMHSIVSRRHGQRHLSKHLIAELLKSRDLAMPTQHSQGQAGGCAHVSACSASPSLETKREQCIWQSVSACSTTWGLWRGKGGGGWSTVYEQGLMQGIFFIFQIFSYIIMSTISMLVIF